MSEVGLDRGALKSLIEAKQPVEAHLIQIRSFAESSYENQLILGSLGYCDILCPLLTLEPYGDDPQVVEQIILTILKLCRREFNKSTACVLNCDRVIESDGGKHLLQAMSKFVLESLPVVRACCYLIMVLAADSQERQRHLTQCGAALAIAAVLFR